MRGDRSRASHFGAPCPPFPPSIREVDRSKAHGYYSLLLSTSMESGRVRGEAAMSVSVRVWKASRRMVD